MHLQDMPVSTRAAKQRKQLQKVFAQHLPTLKEVVDGLFLQFGSTLQQIMKDKTTKQIHMQKQIYRQVFDYVVR